MFGIIYFLTLYLQNVRGYSALESGVRTLPMTLMVMLIAPIAGKLSARIGPRPLMVGGMLIMSLGLASLTRLSLDASYWTVIFPSFICVGAGVSMTMPTTTGVAMGSVDPARAGIASGVVNAVAAGRRRARRRRARLDRRDGRLGALGRQRPGGPAGHGRRASTRS